jgi:hypothetical protein
MHCVGMAAMTMHHYQLELMFLSVIVAVTFSSLAAWLAFRFRRSHDGFPHKLGAASLMGVGIASMHYTGMAATYFMPGPAPRMRHAVEVSTLGAFGIGITTLLLLATVLVSLLFDRRLPAPTSLPRSPRARSSNSASMESRLCTEPFLGIRTASCVYKAATFPACPALNSSTHV